MGGLAGWRAGERSLRIGDVVQRDGASVGGADAADVAEAQQAGDACQAHAGAVQVQVSEMHVFQELDAWGAGWGGDEWRANK